jgi:Glycosyl transferase family 11
MKLTANHTKSKNNLKTIIFTHGGGRFGNQMYSYAYLLAFTLEYKNIDFVNMACWEYSDLLEAGRKDFLCTKLLDKKRHTVLRLIYFCCKLLFIKNGSVAKNTIIRALYLYGGNPLAKYYQSQSILVEKSWTTERFFVAQHLSKLDLADLQSFDLISNANTTFLSGWDICDWKLVQKHQKEIRTSLQIRSKYLDISRIFIAKQREKYDLLVGVMIRQGDYKTWKNGQYYFTSQQYSDWINGMSEAFKLHGKVGFVVSSDSPQNLKDFSNENIHFTTGIAGGNGHYIESLSQLSLCDVLVSPPSSFSMWAAFLGDIPFVSLRQVDQVIKAEQLIDNNWFDPVSVEC